MCGVGATQGIHMLIWGAVWGAIVGYLTSRYDAELATFVGAILGGIAGFTLRKAVRSEIAAQQRQQSQTAVRADTSQDQAAQDAALVPRPSWEPAPVAATLQTNGLPTQAGTTSRSVADLDDEPDEFLDAPPPYLDQAQLKPPARAAQLPATVQMEPVVLAMPDPVVRALEGAKAWLLGGNTIVRAGVLVLFVGLAFLAKYAMDNALLPPELRLAGIGAFGIALLVGGFKLRVKGADKLAYALTLQGAGVAVLYLTVFAAFRLYQFLPGGAAFALLALVCAFSTAIALMQNALPMAFIGFAGAFAAPILASTGQGSHVGLFSYYLVLNIAIGSVAWLRAWRPLNLLGFFATFGVATSWGALKYQSEFFASTEPFLIAFFLVYVVASLFYATRHALASQRAVDGTLVFGTPIVAFGLQVALVQPYAFGAAFSALALGGFYLALASWALGRAQQAHDEQATVGRWLGESFVALGLGFITLAVPLALDARWTSAVWAVEGAAVYWMGQRQGRWLPRAVGLALQVLAAVSYLEGLPLSYEAQWPLANPGFVGAVLLAVSAFALAHWTRGIDPARPASQGEGVLAQLARAFEAVEPRVHGLLFWLGFIWAQYAVIHEVERHVLDADGNWVPVLGSVLQANVEMLAWLVGAFVAQRLAHASRPKPWTIAATPAWFSLPIMGLVALHGALELAHVFQAWGWLVWPAALVLHGLTLRRVDAGTPQSLWAWTHTGGVWLLVLLGGNLLLWAVQGAQLHGTAWASVIVLVASIGVLLALSSQRWMDDTRSARQQWPLDRFAYAYLWNAALPLALAVAAGALLVAVTSDGNAKPLPYVPLLNPTDISIALGLATVALWYRRVRDSALVLPDVAYAKHWPLVLAGLAFVAVNTVWLRVAHHYAGVAWRADVLFESFLVQAGYSILWTVLALGLMVLANRRALRSAWMGGAGLLGLTVLKLFTLDLSNSGGSERIVAFIAVGVLMLVVGYFAPIPPAASEPDSKEETPPAPPTTNAQEGV